MAYLTSSKDTLKCNKHLDFLQYYELLLDEVKTIPDSQIPLLAQEQPGPDVFSADAVALADLNFKKIACESCSEIGICCPLLTAILICYSMLIWLSINLILTKHDILDYSCTCHSYPVSMWFRTFAKPIVRSTVSFTIAFHGQRHSSFASDAALSMSSFTIQEQRNIMMGTLYFLLDPRTELGNITGVRKV